MSLRITNIQRFSLHDGPGIRTTIFLKGCAAKCPWCANPENIDFFTTFSFDEKKCIKDKGHCFLNKECPILRGNKSEAFNNDCISKCKAGALSIVGENISAKYLLSEILKDKEYYGTNGGVTFSGGEVLLQTDSLIEILQELKEKHINVAIESSLFAPFENVKKIIPYVDYYIVDVKILDPYDSKEKLGIEIDIYLKNLKYLLKIINKKNFVWRVPIVENYTDTEKNLEKISKLADELNIEVIEIFSVHNLAKNKYSNINKTFTHFNEISDDKLLNIKKYLEKNRSRDVKIIKI